MAILHINWFPQEQRFLLWGEAWKPLPPEGFSPWQEVYLHPYSLAQEDLASVLSSFQQQLQGRGGNGTLFPPALVLSSQLPSQRGAKASASQAGGRSQPKERRSSGRRPQAAADPIWGGALVQLPTRFQGDALQPLHSATPLLEMADGLATVVYHPWQLQGWWLAPSHVFPLLMALPLGQQLVAADSIGADLRFWGHSYRWGLNLLARGKFLPCLELTSQTLAAGWRPLIDSAVDQQRLRLFALAMPPLCRSYGALGKASPSFSCSMALIDPQGMLISFLTALVEYQVSKTAQTHPLSNLAPLTQDLPLQPWLQALSQGHQPMQANLAAAARLQEALTTWTAPLQRLAEDPAVQFRLRLVLQPPPQTDQPWTLA